MDTPLLPQNITPSAPTPPQIAGPQPALNKPKSSKLWYGIGGGVAIILLVAIFMGQNKLFKGSLISATDIKDCENQGGKWTIGEGNKGSCNLENCLLTGIGDFSSLDCFNDKIPNNPNVCKLGNQSCKEISAVTLAVNSAIDICGSTGYSKECLIGDINKPCKFDNACYSTEEYLNKKKATGCTDGDDVWDNKTNVCTCGDNETWNDTEVKCIPTETTEPETIEITATGVHNEDGDIFINPGQTATFSVNSTEKTTWNNNSNGGLVCIVDINAQYRCTADTVTAPSKYYTVSATINGTAHPIHVYVTEQQLTTDEPHSPTLVTSPTATDNVLTIYIDSSFTVDPINEPTDLAWKISNSEPTVLSCSGVTCTAIAVGTSNITIKSSDDETEDWTTQTVTVNVSAKPTLTSININSTDINTNVGSNIDLPFTLTPENADVLDGRFDLIPHTATQILGCSITNLKLFCTAKKIGETTINVSYKLPDGTFILSNNITITVTPPEPPTDDTLKQACTSTKGTWTDNDEGIGGTCKCADGSKLNSTNGECVSVTPEAVVISTIPQNRNIKVGETIEISYEVQPLSSEKDTALIHNPATQDVLTCDDYSEGKKWVCTAEKVGTDKVIVKSNGVDSSTITINVTEVVAVGGGDPDTGDTPKNKCVVKYEEQETPVTYDFGNVECDEKTTEPCFFNGVCMSKTALEYMGAQIELCTDDNSSRTNPNPDASWDETNLKCYCTGANQIWDGAKCISPQTDVGSVSGTGGSDVRPAADQSGQIANLQERNRQLEETIKWLNIQIEDARTRRDNITVNELLALLAQVKADQVAGRPTSVVVNLNAPAGSGTGAVISTGGTTGGTASSGSTGGSVATSQAPEIGKTLKAKAKKITGSVASKPALSNSDLIRIAEEEAAKRSEGGSQVAYQSPSSNEGKDALQIAEEEAAKRAESGSETNGSLIASYVQGSTPSSSSSSSASRPFGGTIQGHTGPELLLYPILVGLANGAYYVSRKRRK